MNKWPHQNKNSQLQTAVPRGNSFHTMQNNELQVYKGLAFGECDGSSFKENEP